MNTHSIFLDVAETISQMSHCVSHKVGAILVKDKAVPILADIAAVGPPAIAEVVKLVVCCSSFWFARSF